MKRLLVVAASAIARTGLTTLITSQTRDWDVIGLASLKEALSEITDSDTTALLWDLSMQGVALDLDFTELVSLGAVAIAALVSEDSGIHVSDLLQAGIQAVLPGDATAAEILAALEAALAGLVTLHPAFLEDLLDASVNSLQAIPPQPEPALTPREIEVLTRLARGASNKAIAQELMISEHTVKFHLGAIFAKLGVSTRTEAAMAGARLGLIML